MPDLWLPGIERIESLACGPTDLRPIAIMSHIMEGWQRTMIAWAEERPRVHMKSAHFTIGRTGRIVQHVPLNKRSWAAGVITGKPTWSGYRRGVNPNSQVINIEHEGFHTKPWTQKMTAASIRLQKMLCAELNIAPSYDTIIGHFETSTINRANDPGKHWPREQIVRALGGQPPVAAKPAPAMPVAGTAPLPAHHAQHAALVDKQAILAANLGELTRRVDRVEARVSGASDALRAG